MKMDSMEEKKVKKKKKKKKKKQLRSKRLFFESRNTFYHLCRYNMRDEPLIINK